MTFAQEPDRLGERLRDLLWDVIDSYEKLQILLLLRGQEHAWTADEIGARLKLADGLVGPALRDLRNARLVSESTLDPPGYRYAPADEDRREALEELSRSYEGNPVLVMRAMSDNAIRRLRNDALRAFADAFLLRKDR